MLWVDDNVFIVILSIIVIDLTISPSAVYTWQVRLSLLAWVAQIFSQNPFMLSFSVFKSIYTRVFRSWDPKIYTSCAHSALWEL